MSSTPTEVIMPQLGESVVEGTINRWLKQEGDTVEEYEPLLEVASDKVDTEIPAPAGGTVLKIMVQEGETVDAGTVIALIGAEDAVVETASNPDPVTAMSSAPAGRPTTNGDESRSRRTRVSPVVARIAAEHDVDITNIEGTGREGRVTKKDILAYIEEREAAPAEEEELAPWERPGTGDLFKPTDMPAQQPEAQPEPQAEVTPAPMSTPAPARPARPQAAPQDHKHGAPPAQGQPGEVVQLSRMRKLIADHMVQSKLKTAPHVTTVFEADLSAVTAHRAAHKEDFARRGINLTFTAYFVMAAAEALAQHPMVNSQWREDGILLHRDINIGMATAIDDGLIVPVIKNVDDLSLAGVARAVNDLSARARSNRLNADEVSGGTFTITNHGVSGSLFATPIINQPQTAILGVGSIEKRVVVLENDAIGVRPMVYLTLTFDHRVLDGAGADWFMVEVKSILQNWS